jgi:hypothetical protein
MKPDQENKAESSHDRPVTKRRPWVTPDFAALDLSSAAVAATAGGPDPSGSSP